jgi:hypothetical protein
MGERLAGRSLAATPLADTHATGAPAL